MQRWRTFTAHVHFFKEKNYSRYFSKKNQEILTCFQFSNSRQNYSGTTKTLDNVFKNRKKEKKKKKPFYLQKK